MARTTSDWQEKASAVAGIATATRAAESGNRHVITTVVASFSAATIALLQILVGATVVAEHYVYDQAVIAFPEGIRGGAGQAVSAVLAAGAGGVTGKVAIIGATQ